MFLASTLPWNKFDSSSTGSLNWSTYIHWLLGNPKTLQTFSPKNLYLNNLSYSSSDAWNSIEPVSKLPDNDALKILLSLNVNV